MPLEQFHDRSHVQLTQTLADGFAKDISDGSDGGRVLLVRTLLSCKFRHTEFSDLAKTRLRFLQLICEIECKNLCLVPALIASR